MTANNIHCIRYFSDLNPWIDFVVFVPANQSGQAVDAIRRGIDDFFSDDNQSPYGQCVEIALNDAGVSYLIDYYDCNDDDAGEAWENYIDNVEWCPGLIFTTID